MHKISFKELTPTPWKNGQGITHTIAISPNNATVNNFIWRISAATLESPGPFSNFEDVTRSLALLAGETITLKINHTLIQLHLNDSPITFNGNDSAHLIDCSSKGVDLSVMTHNLAAHHTLERYTFTKHSHYQRRASTTLVFALKSCSIEGITLDPWDSILFNQTDTHCITCYSTELETSLLIAEISEKIPSAYSI